MGRLSGFGAALCATAICTGGSEEPRSLAPASFLSGDISANHLQTDSTATSDSNDISRSSLFLSAHNSNGFYQWCDQYMAPFRMLEYQYYRSNNYEHFRRYRISFFQPLGKCISFGPYYTHLTFSGSYYIPDQIVHPAPCMGFSISIDLGFQRKKKPFVPLSPEELPYFDPMIAPRKIPLLKPPELVSAQD